MKEVSTYCRWKFALEAVVRIPVELLLFAAAFLAVPAMVRDEVAHGHGSWGELGFAIIALLNAARTG